MFRSGFPRRWPGSWRRAKRGTIRARAIGYRDYFARTDRFVGPHAVESSWAQQPRTRYASNLFSGLPASVDRRGRPRGGSAAVEAAIERSYPGTRAGGAAEVGALTF
jgi:hypothetical protein